MAGPVRARGGAPGSVDYRNSLWHVLASVKIRAVCYGGMHWHPLAASEGDAMTDPDQVYMTSREFEQLVRRSPRTVARWRSEGTGPAFEMIRGRPRYRRTTVDQWIADQNPDHGRRVSGGDQTSERV